MDRAVLDGARPNSSRSLPRSRSAADGETYNVNADTFAGAIAGAMGAKRLLLLTDVPGVLDKDKNLIQELTMDDCRRLIADGTITGGMIPKVETCIYALEKGVEAVVILNGKVAAFGAAGAVHRPRRWYADPQGIDEPELSMPEPPSRYSAAQKALHWTMAALIVPLVAIAIAMTNLGDGPLTNRLYELHKSFGLTVFTLALVRLACARRGAPPLEPMPAWQRRAAQVSHYALYVLFILVPLAGWIATSYCCAPVNLFWTVPVTLPLPGADMEAAERIFRIHFGLAFALSRSCWSTSPGRCSTISSAATARCCACYRTELHRGGSARRSRWPILQARRQAGVEPVANRALGDRAGLAHRLRNARASSRISAASPRPRRQGLAALARRSRRGMPPRGAGRPRSGRGAEALVAALVGVEAGEHRRVGRMRRRPALVAVVGERRVEGRAAAATARAKRPIQAAETRSNSAAAVTRSGPPSQRSGASPARDRPRRSAP